MNPEPSTRAVHDMTPREQLTTVILAVVSAGVLIALYYSAPTPPPPARCRLVATAYRDRDLLRRARP